MRVKECNSELPVVGQWGHNLWEYELKSGSTRIFWSIKLHSSSLHQSFDVHRLIWTSKIRSVAYCAVLLTLVSTLSIVLLFAFCKKNLLVIVMTSAPSLIYKIQLSSSRDCFDVSLIGLFNAIDRFVLWPVCSLKNTPGENTTSSRITLNEWWADDILSITIPLPMILRYMCLFQCLFWL